MSNETQRAAMGALLTILRQEVGGLPGSCPGVDLLPQVLELAKEHSLDHLVANAYSKAGLLGSDEASEACRQCFMLSFYRSQQQSHVLTQVCQTLKGLQIPHIPLKGAVIRNFYPQSWMRSSCDIDILIHPQDAQKAIDALETLGYRFEKSTSIHDHSLFSPEGIHLELHFSLIQEECLSQANQLLAEAWAYTKATGAELTEEMFLLYHVAHMAKHFIMGGCGIRPFLDLWLLRQKLAADAQALEELLRQAQLWNFYLSALELVEVWFEGKPHSPTTQGMEDFLLQGGSYGTQANVYAIRAAGGESRLQSFLKLMFMSRANLEYMYPQLEGRPALLPYYQVKRWFGFFSKARRSNLKRLTNARSTVTKTKANTTANLLNQLGLE